MKLRHIVLGTTMAAAAVSTIASRALILEAPPEYIFSEAPEAVDSPPEPLDGPGVNASGETMPNMLPAAFQPPEFPALERAEPDNLMALVQALAAPWLPYVPTRPAAFDRAIVRASTFARTARHPL